MNDLTTPTPRGRPEPAPTQPGRRKRGARAVLALTTVGAGCVTALVVGAPAASAAGYDCHNDIASTGSPGGGMNGYCNNTGRWIQEVGLCQNNFTRDSRWVNGPWVHGGASLARCSWWEHPVTGYVRLGGN